jgi:hypothetical protein
MMNKLVASAALRKETAPSPKKKPAKKLTGLSYIKRL